MYLQGMNNSKEVYDRVETALQRIVATAQGLDHKDAVAFYRELWEAIPDFASDFGYNWEIICNSSAGLCAVENRHG